MSSLLSLFLFDEFLVDLKVFVFVKISYYLKGGGKELLTFVFIPFSMIIL